MRRSILGVALVGAFGLLIVATAVAGSGGGSGGWTHSVVAPTGGEQPRTADLDGDKVFDDLEARVERSAPKDKLSVLVQLDEPLTKARFAALSTAVGGVDVTGWLPIVGGFAAKVTANQVRALVAHPGVAQVELNRVVRAYNDSAQASFGVTKARVDDTDLDGNTDGQPTYSAGDVVVAVIDTGIDATHPQLDDGKVLEFADCVDSSCDTTPAPFDDDGHGTHVAGTVAGDGEGNALYRGVAPGAALVGVKVLNGSGSGTEAGVIAGIQWAVDNRALWGIEVLNLSLGADGCFNADEGMISQAVNDAVTAGLHVFVAAGNAGPDLCTVGAPGVATSVVTVGAMADLGTREVPEDRQRPGFGLAWFSSRGPTLDDQVKPDVVGPGVDITSAEAGTGGYVAFQGTSMATPFVAGVAALMLDHAPTRTPAEVKQILRTTAIDWGRGGIFHVPGTTGPDVDYGAGRLDAFAAIKTLGGTTLGDPPPVPMHDVVDGSLAATGAALAHPVQVTTPEFPLSATLIMTDFDIDFGLPDFDLCLVAPNGTTVLSSSLDITRQEEVGTAPPLAPGTYYVVVESYEGSGPYLLDVSGGDVGPPQEAPVRCGPPPPPPPPAGPPACPPTDAPVGGTYRGTHSGGGSVCLTVTPGWTGVIGFLITDVSGSPSCGFAWAYLRPSTPVPINNRSFSLGGLSGSFSTDRGATGTVSFTAGGCSVGPVSWNATTEATPPWVLPPVAPPPPPPPPAVRRCLVPNVKGKTVARARTMLRSGRCALGRVTRRYSGRVRRGKVISQSRRPGARLPRGTRVNVIVSRGSRRR